MLKHSVQVCIGYLLLLILVAACATTSVPTASEISEVLGGKKTLILLRLTVDIDGKASEAFGASLADDNVGLAFITGEQVRRIEFYRSPSDQARQEGWIYVVEDPGTYYLAVQPPRDRDAFSYQFQFRSAPRWRIDALAGSRIVYAGRLHIDASSERGFLFARRTVYDLSKTAVRDERSLARELAAKSFPNLGSPITVLMEPLGVPAAGP